MAWRYPWRALFGGAAGLVFFSASVRYATADEKRPQHPIRVGQGISIVAMRKPAAAAVSKEKPSPLSAIAGLPFPRPRMVGFSPLVAITTSSKHRTGFDDNIYEHVLESSYTCNFSAGPNSFPCGALFPPANSNYIVGVLDSGSDADLLAGASADELGVTGNFLTGNIVPLSGIGGEQVDAQISQPIGFYAQGLSAILGTGLLNMTALVGHSNVSVVAAPTIECGGVVAVSGLVGMPLIAFHNTIIRVDTPRRVNANGRIVFSPDVKIQSPALPLPGFATRFIGMTFSGFATTASYYPDFEDLETPIIPTALSLGVTIPLGGSFYAPVRMLEGPPSPFNTVQTLNMLVDTGAQTSIISSIRAAQLGLPLQPDFEIDACGVGGLVEGIPGYIVDYVRIEALGGPMEFAQAPFVVADLPSASGGLIDGILGMNFFWNRNVILEPIILQPGNIVGGGEFHVSDPIPFSYGDFDLDQYVENRDTEFFTYCLTGPETDQVLPECTHVDADANTTVDLRDYVQFLACYSGAAALADTQCGP